MVLLSEARLDLSSMGSAPRIHKQQESCEVCPTASMLITELPIGPTPSWRRHAWGMQSTASPFLTLPVTGPCDLAPSF